MKVQANNKSKNVCLHYNGESHTIALWADKIGLSIGTLWARKKAGWSVEKMLTEPLRPHGGKFIKGHK